VEAIWRLEMGFLRETGQYQVSNLKPPDELLVLLSAMMELTPTIYLGCRVIYTKV
jgi:hypothetical protein